MIVVICPVGQTVVPHCTKQSPYPHHYITVLHTR